MKKLSQAASAPGAFPSCSNECDLRSSVFLILLLVFLSSTSCKNSPASHPSNASPVVQADDSPAPPDGDAAVLVGAGDVATCKDLSGARAAADLIDHIPGTVFVVGDLALPDGSEEEFANCYAPTWGRFKARTRPALGNHEYKTHGASAYFKYFGAAAGEPGKGYYSYELGAWHIVSLNSNCSEVGGCDAGSPQVQWLRKDLAEHPSACTLAYFHHPLFSSGNKHGDDLKVKPLWQALYEANAEIVINGHDHDYERFAPQDPEGRADPQRGIREFVAGTGGNPSHHAFGDPVANSQVRGPDTYGVLKLTLHPHSYDWQFMSVAGASVTDSGNGTCH
jgi:Calcineurin-like phosphoesterase